MGGNFDYERLRSDLKGYLERAYFMGGHGAALVEVTTVETCSDEMLISIALNYGFDINRYCIEEHSNSDDIESPFDIRRR